MSDIGMVSARFRRGEPIALPLFIETGAAGDAPQRKAVLKRALDGPRVPPSSALGVEEFTITAVAAAGSVGAHFLLSLTGPETLALDPGVYCVTPAFGAGGVVMAIAEPYFLELGETTTESLL